MSIIGIAIGATGLSLILAFLWMLSLSMRRKRLDEERKQREIAYRKALEKSRHREKQERLSKAENGHVPTILFLAKEAERTNIKEALYWYNKAAELDNVNGMYGVVRISQKMREDVILREKSKYWQICISALEGSTKGKFDMGMALLKGQGTEINMDKALEMINASAEESYVPAMLFLGDWCTSSKNPMPAPADSNFWYTKASKKNSNEGRMKLGLNYLNGVGVEKNHSKGCYWLEVAAEKGHSQSMYHAGEAWIDKGRTGNAIAYIWLFLSAHFGYEPAKVLRDKVGGNIGVDSVVGLQSLAKPLIQKITANKVGKHSIIKALNKLYKRDVYLPAKAVVSNDTSLEELIPDQKVASSLNESDSVGGGEEKVEPQAQSTNSDFDYSPNGFNKPTH
ncbi:sel1 repeat family protein [Vibrio sp. ZSDE26]|uniref:Sel1 repeat family protein n=1 Tax=Vibrio amylolyticus TaxID=2847292 RepID=A0A9X1XMD4_9VIBR|nr:tetratricopeptide repeat protein [Vibrio amylolyticus]MCK6264328.1 sel1 repeat family protein [Vibrio amylolyticus]